MVSLLHKILGSGEKKPPEQIKRQLGLKKRFGYRIAIHDAHFVAFDTELTGLDFKRDSLLSIGAVKLKGGSILPARTFYKLVKPESELTRKSVVIHEITHSDLEHAEELFDALLDFIEFIDDAVLIGHFIHIDLNFINRPLRKKYGFSLRNPALDTASLHGWLLENNPRFIRHYGGTTVKTDLFSLAKKYGITGGKAHDAFSDAFITAQLFQRFVHFLPQAGVKTVKELLAVGRP